MMAISRTISAFFLGACLAPAAAAAEPSLDFYGYVKLDAIYDTHALAPGHWGITVPKGASDADGHFSLTANQSRLGVNVGGYEDEAVLVKAKAEVDLYGGTDASGYANANNQPSPRLRLAYGSITWKALDLSLTAGQDWDMASPLNPRMVDFGVAIKAGNLGFRRPQLKVTKGFGMGDGKMTVSAGIIQIPDGGLAQKPVASGRVGFKVPAWAKAPIEFGFSGHYGEERKAVAAIAATDTTPAVPASEDGFDTWSGGLDLQLPICDSLALSLEAFMAKNSAAFVGLAGPDVKSRGGWAQLAIGPFDGLNFTLVGGMEDVPSGDRVTGAAGRNRVVAVNTSYALAKGATVSLEGAQHETEYEGADTEDDIRAQLAFQFDF